MAIRPFEHIAVFMVLPTESKTVLLLQAFCVFEYFQGIRGQRKCPAAAGVFGFVLGWGITGVWFSFLFGLTSAGAMFYLRFRSTVRKKETAMHKA